MLDISKALSINSMDGVAELTYGKPGREGLLPSRQLLSGGRRDRSPATGFIEEEDEGTVALE